MQNGFKLHNIEHLSPSSINTWIADPAYWILTKLYKKSYPFGFSAKRGTVIENAVVNVIAYGMSEEDALKLAYAEYDKFGVLSKDERKLKEREAIEPSIKLALKELKEYGEPEFTNEKKQHKVEITCKTEKFEIPVIGFLDLVYPKHGLIIDLKTTSRMPTEMSDAHKRQSAIYSTAEGNKNVKFLYVTPKKAQFHQCEDIPGTMRQIKQAIIRQESFLSLNADKDELAKYVHVNPETYYWDSLEAVTDRKNIYGI